VSRIMPSKTPLSTINYDDKIM